MGASYISRRIKETDRTAIENKFDEIVEECLYEYGHDSYNGTFSTMHGIKVRTSNVFSDRYSADEFIAEHTEKWGSAMAVTVKEKGQEPYTVIGGWAAE